MQNVLLEIFSFYSVWFVFLKMQNAKCKKKKKCMFQQNERILTISLNQTTNPTPPTTQTTTRLAKTHPPPPWHSTNHSNPQIGEGKKKEEKKAKVSQPPTITHKPSPYHGPQTIPTTQKLNHQWTHKNTVTHHNP